MTHFDLASLSLSLLSVAFPALVGPVLWRWVHVGAPRTNPPRDPNPWSCGSHASEF